MELDLSCLRSKLSFQVHEPGFWGMFEKQRNLDGDDVDFVIYYAGGHGAAARKIYCNRWKKKKSRTTIFVYLGFTVMKTGSKVLSIGDGWKQEKSMSLYLFIFVGWSCDHVRVINLADVLNERQVNVF